MTLTPPVVLDVDAVLLDIEGTTSSIRFVTEVMFPYARTHTPRYLVEHWNDAAVQEALDLMAVDAGHANASEWFEACELDESTSDQARIDFVVAEVGRLMNADIKATGLKQLQGLVWRGGFESGEMQAHVYDEVPDAIRRWRDRGIDVRIYSSGSVDAQRLFFAHTTHGDLLSLFRGHYDTRIGGKREAESYRRIAAEFGLAPERILFVSDLAGELVAANEAGMRTALSIRPENEPVPDETPGFRIHSFDSIILPDRTDGESRR